MTLISKRTLLATLVTLLLAVSATAQPRYTVLKNFKDADGIEPWAGLTISGSTLYGTTCLGGAFGLGTVFKLNTNGYTVLKHCTDSDGRCPASGLTLFGSTLYGTAMAGGDFDGGTVFAISTNGTGYTVLMHCYESEGRAPYGGVTLHNNILFGTTMLGGDFGCGVVFAVPRTNYAIKHFNGSDGSRPNADLTLSGSTLYGTTGGIGTVFKINTDGTGFNVLKRFGASDGGGPARSGLTLSGSTLYGVAARTLFKINTDGTDFAVLKDFNMDGPGGNLTLSGNTLYGVTTGGGPANAGTVFKINTDGTGFAVLKIFTTSDGACPCGGMPLSGTTLYGTTQFGGSYGNGVIFALSLEPAITDQPQSRTNQVATTATFTATASGDLPLAYQWFRNDTRLLNGGNISGATTNILVVGTVMPENAANYSVVITNNHGSVTSQVAVLTVTAPEGYNQITGQLLGTGVVALSYIGIPGSNYALECTFNLAPANWVPLVTNTATPDGGLIFTNTPNPNTNNFWRVRSAP